MSSYTINYKYGRYMRHARTARELKYCSSMGVFNKTILFHLLLLDSYSQLGAMHFFSHLPSHIQCALME